MTDISEKFYLISISALTSWAIFTRDTSADPMKRHHMLTAAFGANAVNLCLIIVGNAIRFSLRFVFFVR
jgi:hypothetical protein